MNVLVVGSGGREHTICWKIAQSKTAKRILCAPGNPGIAGVAKLCDVAVDDVEGLVSLCEREKVDFVIVGPELPLSLGLVDTLKKKGIKAFGPSQMAAQLESSKAFCKEVMKAANVPTAGAKVASSREQAQEIIEEFGGVPAVLKADGLAAGKGVFVCFDEHEVQQALESLYLKTPERKVLVEEFMEGVEVSYIVCAAGEIFVPFTSSHDYKRIGEGNKGLNTGGMGSVSPSPYLSGEQEEVVKATIIQPVLNELAARGMPFTGFLYAGLMVCPDGNIRVVEFNARLGDPETQVIIPRLKSDLLELLVALVEGTGQAFDLEWSDHKAMCVVHASAGYPESSSKGDEITGLEQAMLVPSSLVFHAGTKLNESGKVCTNGGRVLGVVGLGETLEKARDRSYQASDMIQFSGKQMRRDIGGSNSATGSA